ncbi:hypothetical protein HBI56_170300 [Parastagonospora nodorum]|uniref:Uncharacterized protein n=2 Tax=Phaeosphaeria nodorum (strain SN15 / ATCC MYA-4574 / FGSC 10173) TaxID=321614 RepID=Q0UTM6_PHANO|nr:hypothetical protein SNOG_04888 [Parastagonospora nodorum SN15]KAH3903756.1 hypothetical protein HBH56_245160 [Parastagonospora nodorum]EAT87279.1 hypothetical protein SNOG_04888 [Parastagonospora nodorum SN15]KAH3935356.1 hypothetical protein HBH54_034230 [Parastagonospora nodorum]KAH3938706.1 hypothetical protein HBH53_247240 [Parastagonospora nodorum]KAH3988618.1 hypothetical protein HBH52_023420 [Parastagonospora nodorum]
MPAANCADRASALGALSSTPPAMIVLYGLSLASLVLSAVGATDLNTTECQDHHSSHTEPCTQPIEDVVAVTRGSFYIAKIRCYDCPHANRAMPSGPEIVLEDNDLLFNIELSNDKRTVFLNNQPFFPTLPTIPTPPQIQVPQVRTDFSNTNLSIALECHNPSCGSGGKMSFECTTWCWELQLDTPPIDYLYTKKRTEYNGDDSVAEAEHWEFGFDAIGSSAPLVRHSERGFDHPKQKMLKVVVEGVAVDTGAPRKGQDTLFSPIAEDETIYDYRIIDVKLVDREYKFPILKPLSLHQSILRFFGNDVWEDEGRLVYIHKQWNQYGKAGTLRSLFGDFIHWELWELVAIIAFSVVGGLLALYGVYRLFFWVQAQRELMKWDGMDDVWDKLRREREEEENALLNGVYRDEPDEGSSPRPPQYTDDLDTMKPLPTKPLPEKPLPDVPLIDA